MAGLELTVSPGFLLLAAGLYFVGGGGALTAFLSAALAHELGHLTALALAGASLTGIRLTAWGPVLEYNGTLTASQEAGSVAAGPVSGLGFAGLCAALDTPYFAYAGAIALLGTMFNLLPVLPMDGGRLALYLLQSVFPEKNAQDIMRLSGTVCGLLVTMTGFFIRSPAAAAAGIWMTGLANIPNLR
jgi:stage IV sporulation protein FB